MISFSRNEKRVTVSIKHGVLGNDEIFSLSIHQDYEYQASLLCGHLKKEMSNKLEAIRREAYEQGWKDAKAKRAKQSWFKSWW